MAVDVRSGFGYLLDVVDRLEWTATGAERWLASATIAALGLLSASTQVLFLLQTEPTTIEVLFTAAIPLLLSGLVLVASVWLPRSEYGRFLPRIALWCVVGAVVLVASSQLVLLSQRLLGTSFDAPLFVHGYLQTVGTAIGFVVGLYDAGSEERKLELDAERERAERYAQQVSVLNRILRHDLRTGVQVIQQYAAMLPNPQGMEPTIPVDRIQEQARDMYETAESAREIDRLMGDPDRLTDESNVSDEIDSAIEAVEATYPDATIDRNDGGSATIPASRILDLAFTELLTNAIEHNEGESSEVAVFCESNEAAVEVRIADDGPGIPDAEVEPIEKGEETDLVHSSGIGLWLANWIVGMTDGSLSFEENEMGGTTVVVRLPR